MAGEKLHNIDTLVFNSFNHKMTTNKEFLVLIYNGRSYSNQTKLFKINVNFKTLLET